ncbi:tRNA/rRNA methyltransferase [Geoalkalibacter ferrihydriticus]|uniref:tRNA (cytidine/uridine-2'-O-)-methyltransferase TrmJ n=2 Tax=Geoalkalibacter ferrihydriticus TaxID=392333 RepID=A0A0C2DTM4_9BACT|nr:RNA methyltransferase [Geoalkalibacter ferrihydriticus]KIH76804.1 RNA methyltransferase [Geoalkalibacter ferrihydriticus DSM 17813]SDL50134.1 tRNA/rRNA methyltransferase [Geoalkalibacter ferrihydriticus]
MNPDPQNISVVLVEPQGDRNIGSVCRAMMNFGFNDLRLVCPQTDHLTHEARQMAVKATAVLEQAGIYESLEAALSDCRLVLGTTRRFGKYREDFLHPDEAAEFFLPLTQEGRVALVFGREDRGLLTAELDLCQRFITIPTSDELPSMNLAQAVALCLYDTVRVLRREVAAGRVAGRKKLAPSEDVEGMFGHMRQTLLDIEFLNPDNPDHILRSFRRIFGRAGLNEREVRILRGLWRRIDFIEGQRRCLADREQESEKVS